MLLFSSVTRSAAAVRTWFYDLRFNRYEWARIWVTSDGMIAICSDYGNFGYWFGAPGCGGIRKFLIQADPGPGGYIAIKLSDGERVYDGNATLKGVKEHILSHRRERDTTRDEASEEWELLREHSGLENIVNYSDWVRETKIGCAYEFHQESLPGKVQGFMKHAWPVFVAALKREIEAEEAHASAFGTMQEMGV